MPARFALSRRTILVALAADLCLWHALHLLKLMPFALDLGEFDSVRFFTADWLGGLLFAALATLWLWLLRTPGMPHLRGLALLQLALSIVAVPGGSAWQALLPDALTCGALLLAYRQYPTASSPTKRSP